MTIYKSTKIGLAVAGLALAAQLTTSFMASAPAPTPANEPATTTLVQQTVETAESKALKDCMNTRTGRSTDERGATDRSETERKTRWEIYAEREANCKASLNAAATATTTTTEPTATIGGGTPYAGYSNAMPVPKAAL